MCENWGLKFGILQITHAFLTATCVYFKISQTQGPVYTDTFSKSCVFSPMKTYKKFCVHTSVFTTFFRCPHANDDITFHNCKFWNSIPRNNRKFLFLLHRFQMFAFSASNGRITFHKVAFSKDFTLETVFKSLRFQSQIYRCPVDGRWKRKEIIAVSFENASV